MNKHNIGDLYQMQSLPLNAKVNMTITRVRGWLDHWDDECYISFSGGKDSTVLVDIIHNKMGRKDIPLVFVDTGLEYPEVREFVKSYGDKVTWLKPKMNFRQVIEKYGYPMISKEVSECVQGARKYLTSILQSETVLTDRQTDRQTVPLLVRQGTRNREVQESTRTNGTDSTEIIPSNAEILETAHIDSIRGGIDTYSNSRQISYVDSVSMIHPSGGVR